MFSSSAKIESFLLRLSESFTGTKNPFSPSLIYDLAPPIGQSVQIVGIPIASASSMEFRVSCVSVASGRMPSVKAGKTRFFMESEKGGEQKYLGAGKEAEIDKLATKYYALKLKSAAEKELKQLDKCLQVLDSEINKTDKADIDLVYDSMPEAVRERTSPSVVTDDGYAESWQKEKYIKFIAKGNTRFQTKRGEYVRSKSELIIANMLFDAGVPYRYEQAQALSVELMIAHHPDFCVLNKRTRQEYIWEHQGMMDDAAYCSDKIRMLSDYMSKGYFLGKNLLMTFETRDCPLSTEDVNAMIKEYLL